MIDNQFNPKTRDELESAATKISDAAPEEYKHSVFLYFIARFFVAVFEAKFAELPIQVWNEYRNALDHFFRHITSGDEDSRHMAKFNGHIQRAVLDISKIICHMSAERFEANMAKENAEALRLVNDGDFHSELLNKIREAEKSFIQAKVTDGELGEDRGVNKQVLRLYLDACFNYFQLEDFLSANREKIDKATYNLLNIQSAAANEANKHSFKGHVLASLVSKTIWVVAGSVLLLLSAAYGQPMWIWIKEQFK